MAFYEETDTAFSRWRGCQPHIKPWMGKSRLRAGSWWEITEGFMLNLARPTVYAPKIFFVEEYRLYEDRKVKRWYSRQPRLHPFRTLERAIHFVESNTATKWGAA